MAYKDKDTVKVKVRTDQIVCERGVRYLPGECLNILSSRVKDLGKSIEVVELVSAAPPEPAVKMNKTAKERKEIEPVLTITTPDFDAMIHSEDGLRT